ncbi:MAG TPA: hypothetical protein DEP60_05580 [Ruminococcaceae bacterium]|jgi:hypothetical protein|nr:hypothetical protein [Oscillospiraceae bacterium]
MANNYSRQKDKLEEIRKTLKSVIDGYKADPDKMSELLEFKNRFWNYSLNNSILILRQNPNATFVASYRGWSQKGYHVCKGQHGIKVLYPIRTELIPLGEQNGKRQYRRVADATPEEKEKIASGKLKTVTYTRFGIGTVFDISQTDCPPEDYPRFYDMGYSSKQHAELYQAVKQFAESKGIPVKEADLQSISLRGAFYPKENVIRISDKLNDTERLSTLTHELGHALMHNSREAFNIPEPVRELEADAISIMLQKRFGIELTDSRKQHLTDNYRACTKLKGFDLSSVLKAVNKSYFSLRKEMQPMFDKAMVRQQKQRYPTYDPEDPNYQSKSHKEVMEFAKKYYPSDCKFMNDFIYNGFDPDTSLYDMGLEGDAIDNYSPDVELVAKEIKYALSCGYDLNILLRKNYLPEQMSVLNKAIEENKRIPESLRALTPSKGKKSNSYVDRREYARQDFLLSKRVDSKLEKLPEGCKSDKALVALLFSQCSLQKAADFYSRMLSYQDNPPKDNNPDEYDWGCWWKDHLDEARDKLAETNQKLQPIDQKIENILQKVPHNLEKEPMTSRSQYQKQPFDALDYIKNEVSLLTVAKDMGLTPVKVGGYYSLAEHDSVRIYPETNSYYQFSAGTGGSPIDFVMHFGGYSKDQAIKALREQYVNNNNVSTAQHCEKKVPQEKPPEKKELILPEKVQGKYSRAYAYLVKTRCLDAAIVTQCIKDGLIYEDTKHNVVFVGKDKNGQAAFATRHTTLTGSSFKRDVAGSRQDIGWIVNSPKAQKLYVCEAPIDALSIMTLKKQENKPIDKFAYLATCGTGKDKAVYTRLQENSQIKEVVLANDNDGAGKEANLKIYNTLKQKFPNIQVELLRPNNGKDINECLCKKPKKGRNMAQEVER